MGRAFKIGTGLESHVGGEILEAFNVFNLVADVPFLNSQTDPFLNASILVLTAFIGTGATQQYNVSITSAYFPVWLQILYDGTDLNFAYSFDGTQYNTIFSATPAAFIGSNPDTCGLHFGNLVSLPDFTNQGATDYFRRTF